MLKVLSLDVYTAATECHRWGKLLKNRHLLFRVLKTWKYKTKAPVGVVLGEDHHVTTSSEEEECCIHII